MSITARSTGSRIATLAAGLALALSVVAAPAVVAQDDGPHAPVEGLLADIQAGNFDSIGRWFCPEFADWAAALGMSELLGSLPPDVDPASVLEAFAFDVQVESITTVSETDTEAQVAVVALLSMNINVAALTPLIEALLSAGGQEVTPDMIEMFGGMMAAEIGDESIDINVEVTVIRNEDGTWGQICSELGAGSDGDGDATASPAASPSA